MPVDKNEVIKIANIARDFLPLEEISSTINYLIYIILCEKKDITKVDVTNIDINLNDTNIKKLKSLLENYSIDELIDISYNFVTRSNELGTKQKDSSNAYLNNLIISLLDIRSGDIIFDLGSGIGSFLVSVSHFCKENNINIKEYLGLEINNQNALMSKINLSISDISNYQIKCGHFMDEFNLTYNKGFVYPPFGFRLPNFTNYKSKLFDYTFTRANSYEWLFVDTLLANLRLPNSKAVALLPSKCLMNDNDKEYRDYLIKSGYIETIIDLPVGTLSYLSIKMVLVLFSKNNKSVKVVDASGLKDKSITRFSKFELDYKEVLSLIKSSPSIDNDKLLASHSLVPSNLLAVINQNISGTTLKDIASVFSGSQYTCKRFKLLENKTSIYRILTSSDINEGIINYNKLQYIEYSDNKLDKYAIRRNDVIITSKSSKVKVAVVDIDIKEKIIVTGGMIIIRPDIDKINPTYLKIYLESKKGENIIKGIQRGTILISINPRDLMDIVIPLIPIEKQNEIAVKYNKVLAKYIALKEELLKVEDELHSFDIDED